MARMFTDKSIKPNNKSLSEVLGKSYKLWEDLKDSLEEGNGKLIEEWKFYGQKIGWTLKLLLKKRNLFFFAPYEKHFNIAFVFGDKAVSVIEQSDLPKNMIDELRNAKKYVEGRGLLIEVRKKSDLKKILKLTAIKIKN